MRGCVAVLAAWAIMGCSHFVSCKAPEMGMPVWVAAVGRTMTFSIEMPPDVSAVWIRYGASVNEMGYTTGVQTTRGETIVVKNLRPGRPYFFQVAYQRPCGTAYGPIRQYLTSIK